MSVKYKVLVEVEIEFNSDEEAHNQAVGVVYVANRYAEMAKMYGSIAANYSEVILIEKKA